MFIIFFPIFKFMTWREPLNSEGGRSYVSKDIIDSPFDIQDSAIYKLCSFHVPAKENCGRKTNEFKIPL